MKRKRKGIGSTTYILAGVLLIITVISISTINPVQKGSIKSSKNTNFQLMVSDKPTKISTFDYLKIRFSHARVFPKSAIENDSIYEKVETSNKSVDLTTVVGEKAETIANVTLEPGNYSKIELYTESINASIERHDVDVKIPPGKLMITKEFNVKPNKTTKFVFDMEVILRGNNKKNQEYILKPVISKSGVAGK